MKHEIHSEYKKIKINLNMVEKKSFINYFNKLLKRKENNLVPDIIQKSLINYRLTQDPKENKETDLPKDEKISFKCLWVFEVYTPNYISNLIKRIDSLKWNSPSHNYKLSKIVEKARESSFYSWNNLGYIEAKKQNSKYKELLLPEGVDFVIGSLFQYLPSTTILSIQFIFNNEISNLFENKIKKEYTTYLKKVENGYRYISPFHQKKEEIDEVRNDIYERCYKWFRENLPGLYSDNVTNVKFPTCEFITLKEGIPFEKRKKFKNDYINVLSLANEFDAWVCNDLRGVLLEFSTSMNSNFTSIKIAGNSTEILSDKDLKPYSGLKNHAIEHYLQHLDSSLVIWVLYVLMKTYKCNLSRIRDSIAYVSFENINKATSEINSIRKNFALLDRNIPYFMNEFKNLSKIPFSSEVYKFKPLESHPFNKDIELFDNILKISIKETNNMVSEYENVRQAIETTSNIILSIINEKLFRRNIILQWVMIVLTILIIILTVIILTK